MSTRSDLGKIGFVLPSGFMKGAFQAGALKVFAENDIIPSYIIGVSVGAINGAMFTSGKADLLVKTYRDIAAYPKRYLYRWSTYNLVRAFFWNESILTNEPLGRLMIDRLSPQQVSYSQIKLDIIATDYQAGKAVIFSNHNPEHKSSGVLMKALLSSSAMPMVFPPVWYQGHQLFDGAVMEKAPLSYALSEGCETIFLILNDAQRNLSAPRLFKSVYSIARRTTELLSWRDSEDYLQQVLSMNGDIEAFEKLKDKTLEIADRLGRAEEIADVRKEIAGMFDGQSFSFQGKKKVRIFIIEPDVVEDVVSRTKHSSLIFDRELVARYLESGYVKAKALLQELNLLKT